MSIAKQKDLLSRVAQKIFEEATSSSLGSTFHVIISFHLRNKFGKDPYEVLLEDPKGFYNGLQEVLGAGAEAVINLVGAYLAVKYSTTCTTEEFTKLFTEDSKQPKTLSQILTEAISQEEDKLKVT